MKTTHLLPFLAALATARIPIELDELDFKMGLVPRQTTRNLQVFTGALGGVQASAISQSDDPTRPFEVDGDTFVSCFSYFMGWVDICWMRCWDAGRVV